MYYFEDIDAFKALLPSLFTSDELSAVGYSDYTPADLEVILGRSEGFIDGLRYKGKFVEEYQAHAFPRKLNTGYVVSKYDERVQKGVCMVAYDTMLFMKEEKTGRYEAIKQGVKSISTAGVSESYGSFKEVESSKVSPKYKEYLDFVLFNKVI